MTTEGLGQVLLSILGVGQPQRNLPIPVVVHGVPASLGLALRHRVHKNDTWLTESVLW